MNLHAIEHTPRDWNLHAIEQMALNLLSTQVLVD